MSETLTQPQLQVRGWQAIAGTIDHTILKPETSLEQVIRLCEEAAHYGFAAVCVNPWWIGAASSALRGTAVKVATTIGFPLGSNHTTVKRFEAVEAIRLGAQELDMVMNIGALKSRERQAVQNDIAAVEDGGSAAAMLALERTEVTLPRFGAIMGQGQQRVAPGDIPAHVDPLRIHRRRT